MQVKLYWHIELRIDDVHTNWKKLNTFNREHSFK